MSSSTIQLLKPPPPPPLSSPLSLRSNIKFISISLSSSFYSPLLSLSSSSTTSSSSRAQAFSRYNNKINNNNSGYNNRFNEDEYRGDDNNNSDDEESRLRLSSVKSNVIRLIDENLKMIGVVTKSEARRRANEVGLDVVVVSPDADPPVAKIMSFDKYRYEQLKKDKKTPAARMDMKEVKMGCKIDVHDYSVRLKACRKFLNEGDRVKVIVNWRGRKDLFFSQAIELITKFRKDLGELVTEETNNFSRKRKEEFTDRFVFMVVVPNKNLVKPKEPSNTKDDSATAATAADALAATEDSATNEVSAATEISAANEVSAVNDTSAATEVLSATEVSAANEVSVAV